MTLKTDGAVRKLKDGASMEKFEQDERTKNEVKLTLTGSHTRWRLSYGLLIKQTM